MSGSESANGTEPSTLNTNKQDMMTNSQIQRLRGRWSFIPRLAMGLPLLACVAFAQQEESSDVVVLDPFMVTAGEEAGYSASNSIAGTRTNTPIREIPLNIQVFTKDLAEDLLMTSQIDMQRYNASLVNGGADVHSSNAIQQAYNGFLFRGFIQNWGLRDGVRSYDPIDAQGLERVEIIKGPAAAMYGVTYPGGVMNSITKQADLFRSFAQVRATVASEGEWRATIDANATSDTEFGKLAVRFNGAKTESRDPREHSDGKIDYELVNVAWAPVRGTKVQFTAEHGYREKPNGLGYFSTGGTSIGSDVPLQETHSDIPYTWNWATPNNPRTSEVNYFRGEITQTVGDNLSINAYMQSLGRTNVDSDGWDAAGGGGSAASWDLGWSSRGGNATGWLNPNTQNEKIAMHYHYRHWQNYNRAAGVTAVYTADFAGLHNTFTAGAHTWNEKFNTKKGTQPEGSANILYFPVAAGIDINVPSGPPSDYFWDRPERENSSSTYYFGSWQIAALDNKLRANLGLNRTELNLKSLRTAGNDPHFYWNKTNETKIDKWSPMVGLMYDVTEQVSLFAVHSTSLFPTTDKNSLMEQMPPVEGESVEVGAKLELMDGKVSGTVSYYVIEQTGGAQNDPNAENLRTRTWDGLSPAQRELQFPGMTRNELLGDLVAGAVQQSKGMEMDVVITPNKNWQVLLSYARTDQETTDAVNKALEGLSTTGLIKDQLSFLGKYSFTEGNADGLSLGLGGQYAGKALQGYQNDVARYNPETFYLEAFATYRFDLFGKDALVQFNVKNLTEQEEFTGWVDTGNANEISTERYEVPTKARFSLTFGMDF
jgi:outer membrane receptor protein involved in Fe transport